MMKAKLLICSLLMGTALLAIAAKDPVLMTINGKDIKLSEFEYLYHKNNQQQIEKETLEQYVDRFVLYKQKVADAEAAGIDTTEVFRREFDGYCSELAEPFMADDTTYRWQFITEAYDRAHHEVDIDHMMLPLGNTPAETQSSIERMDSIRNCILAGQPWEELADELSSDPSKVRNHGKYGFIGVNTFPYGFENVVYTTPVGEVSQPFKTQFGVHMVRVNGTRPYDAVHAEHILVLFPRGAQLTPEVQQATKVKADSIYNLLMAGADFEEMARTLSEDPGSAKRGGDLGWFGRGRMVKPFEDAAFSLADGEVSKPVASQYGFHIIKKLGHGVPSLDEMRPAIEKMIERDERSGLIKERRLADLKSKYGFKLNPDAEALLRKELEANGGYDSAFIAQTLSTSQAPLFTYGGKHSVPVSQLMTVVNKKAKFVDINSAHAYLMSQVDPVAERLLTEYNGQQLMLTNDEYRNLINEYRDGMLLFEISNRRVWKAASKDTVGLEQHFAQNRGKYNWNEPHFKGIILSAKNDSVLNAVKEDMKVFDTATLTDELHKKYGNDIRMERMVVKQGENPYADYLAFNVPGKPERKAYPEFMILEGSVIDNPEEMSDVRGAVASDYQDVLEKQWIEELAAKYPANINNKVLKKVK